MPTTNFPMQCWGACFSSDPKWKDACETRGEDIMVWAVCVIPVGYEADTSDSFSPGGAVGVCYGTTSSPDSRTSLGWSLDPLRTRSQVFLTPSVPTTILASHDVRR